MNEKLKWLTEYAETAQHDCPSASDRYFFEQFVEHMPEIRKDVLAEQADGREIVPVVCPKCSMGAYMFHDELYPKEVQ